VDVTRRKRTTRVVLPALLLIALLAATTPFAHAHFFTASPKVTIQRVGKRFYGRIKSRYPGCKQDRKVRLVRVREGISDRVVATTRTGPRGKWSIRRRRPQGSYYAVIPRKRKRYYRHGHTCRRDRSRATRRR
jgi:hypothetical protein